MASNDLVDMIGVVTEICGGDNFKVKTENGHMVLAKPGGKLRKNKIRIVVGDRVRVEVSVVDLSVGRISYRFDK